MLKVFLMMIVASILFSSCNFDDRVVVETIRNKTKLFIDAPKGLHKVGDTVMMEISTFGWEIVYDDSVHADTILYPSAGKYREVYRKAIVREIH